MVVGAAGAVNGDFLSEVEAQFGHSTTVRAATSHRSSSCRRAPRGLETRDSDQAHLRLGVRGLETRAPTATPCR